MCVLVCCGKVLMGNEKIKTQHKYNTIPIILNDSILFFLSVSKAQYIAGDYILYYKREVIT